MTLSPNFRNLLLAGLISSAFLGCNTTGGAKQSWWPWSGSGSVASDAMGSTTSSLSDTSRGLTGQWNSLTAATNSAYQKTKSTVTGVFSTQTPTDHSDPTKLGSKIESIGPEVYVAYGQVCETTGKFNDAMENYNKALSIAPTNSPALASIARLHERQNNSTQAIEFYQKAIASTPNDAQLYNDLGMLYSRTGKPEEARQKIEQAIAIRPNESKYHSNLASVYLDSGKTDLAMQTMQKGNTPAMANYNMAVLLAQRNQLPAAQQYLATALQQDPNLQPARDMMNKLGGPQAMQQTYNAYQTASNVYQAVRDISSTTPANGQLASNPMYNNQQVAPASTNAVAPQAIMNPLAPVQPGTPVQPAMIPNAPTNTLPSLPAIPSIEGSAPATNYR
jgi:Flp pilus assembly protein TadD